MTMSSSSGLLAPFDRVGCKVHQRGEPQQPRRDPEGVAVVPVCVHGLAGRQSDILNSKVQTAIPDYSCLVHWDQLFRHVDHESSYRRAEEGSEAPDAGQHAEGRGQLLKAKQVNQHG